MVSATWKRPCEEDDCATVWIVNEQVAVGLVVVVGLGPMASSNGTMRRSLWDIAVRKEHDVFAPDANERCSFRSVSTISRYVSHLLYEDEP